MAVSKKQIKKEVIEYQDTDTFVIPASDADDFCCSLKDMRDLLEATKHLPGTTMVTFASEYPVANVFIDPTQNWEKVVEECKKTLKDEEGKPYASYDHWTEVLEDSEAEVIKSLGLWEEPPTRTADETTPLSSMSL